MRTGKERVAVSGTVEMQEDVELWTSDGVVRITLIDYRTTAGRNGAAHRSVLRVESPLSVRIVFPHNEAPRIKYRIDMGG